MLAVVMAALRSVHGAEPIDQHLSLSYVANDTAATYRGMMMAIPEEEWRVFSGMSPSEMGGFLKALAQKVRLKAYRKSPRGARSPDRNARGTPSYPMSQLPKFLGIDKPMLRHLNRAGLWRLSASCSAPDINGRRCTRLAAAPVVPPTAAS